jgi:hypothetical protein
VKFEVFTAVTLKFTVFWDVTPCNPVEIHPCFCLYPVFRGEKQAVNRRRKAIGSDCFLQVDCLVCCTTLRMEAVSSAETSVNSRTTHRHIPQDSILHSQHKENLTSSCAFSSYKDRTKVYRFSWV